MTDHLQGLLPHHLTGLRARGLNDTTITAAGYRSETDAIKIGSILGWKYPAKKLGAVIVIPFHDADGNNGYCRVRPDNPRVDKKTSKPIKYESPTKQPNRVYLPPGDAEHLQNPTQELAITEGEFKAAALSQELLPAIGLVGVNGWKPKDHAKLLPELEAVAWNGRPTFLIPDSDFATNENVQEAFAWLAHHLTARGARVKLVQLPDGPPDMEGKPTKLGADDFLAKHGPNGKAELRKLLDSAEDPPAVDPESMMRNAEQADPAKEAAAILKATEKDGVYKLRSHRGEFVLWNVGKFAALPESDINAQVTLDMNRHLYMVKKSHVGNVVAQLKAQSIIYSSVTPPAWLDDAERKWKPEEAIVCKNGVVNLAEYIARRQCLSPATPRFFTFNSIDYDFNPAAAEPVQWLKFLNQLWPDDPESIATLQEWAGYLLTPWTSLQKILCVIGPRRAGKGVLARVLRSVIGDSNVASPTLSSLSSEYGLWALLDKTAAFITDARMSSRTDSAIVVERLLNMSGEDSIDVPRKYLETLKSVKLPVRVVLFSNEQPAFSDSSGALSGRMIWLYLKQSFFGQENPRLTEELMEERAGILLWAIEGWKRLRAQGCFVQPESGRELADQMEELTSPVATFVRECCIVMPERTIPCDELYNAWAWWARQKGRREPGTEAIFGKNLAAAVQGIHRRQARKERSRFRVYDGIDLNAEVQAELDRTNVGGMASREYEPTTRF